MGDWRKIIFEEKVEPKVSVGTWKSIEKGVNFLKISFSNVIKWQTKIISSASDWGKELKLALPSA